MLHPQEGYHISHFSYAWLPKRTIWKEEAGPFQWRSLANTASAGCSWWHSWSWPMLPGGSFDRMWWQWVLRLLLCRWRCRTRLQGWLGGCVGQSPSPSFWILSFQLFPLHPLRLRLPRLHLPSHPGLMQSSSESPRREERKGWKTVQRSNNWKPLEFGKRYKPTDSRTKGTPNKRNPVKSKPRYIIVKLLKDKDKNAWKLWYSWGKSNVNRGEFLLRNHGVQKEGL